MHGEPQTFDLMQSQLAQLARLAVVAEMASAMAHEINQPLTAIAAYASALERLIGVSDGVPGQSRDIAHEIGEQALRAGNVVRRIRALVKHTEFELQPIDGNEAVRDLLILAEPLARAHSIAIGLALSPTPLPIRGDALQLQLLLLNLVQNAIEAVAAHAPPVRAITLGSRASGMGEVELFVEDTGGGIPPGFRESLFRPFATTKPHGTGLGLLACQRIAHAHGGELNIDDRPGVGACIAVRLPAG